MVGTVTVVFGMTDIVLHHDHTDVVLTGQHVRDCVDIVHEGTDHADARDIVQVLHHRLQRNRESAALKLLDDAHGLLHPGLDHLDGVPLVTDRKLVIQDFQLGLHLPDRTGIFHHRFLELVRPPVHAVRHRNCARDGDERKIKVAVRAAVDFH